jgi:hypothetical protein
MSQAPGSCALRHPPMVASGPLVPSTAPARDSGSRPAGCTDVHSTSSAHAFGCRSRRCLRHRSARCLRRLQRAFPLDHPARQAPLRAARMDRGAARRDRAHRAVRRVRGGNLATTGVGAGRACRRPRPVVAGARPLCRADRADGRPGAQQDLLQHADAAFLQDPWRGRGDRVRRARHRTHRPPDPSGAAADLQRDDLSGGTRPAGARRFPFRSALCRPGRLRRAHRAGDRGPVAALGRRAQAARGGDAADRVLSRTTRLPGRPRVRRARVRAAGDRAGARGRRPARRRGDGATRRCLGALRHHPQLFPGGPGNRGRCRGVPAHPAAEEAGQRDLHRARPRQAGQDRALPPLLPPFRGLRRAADAGRWREGPGDGGVQPAELPAGIQDHPRPLRAVQADDAPGRGRQVPVGVQARPRRAPDRRPGIPLPALPAGALRPRRCWKTCSTLAARASSRTATT